ncbi:M20/M25/M40 family metallo-hydrolase [Baekduia soli]|uniref:M20/M25/M40 family metallo-hydrolase n=1 Tax=Baekduia soli TaxID=496014 RepID=A0A5B8U7S2_9ACTN|nr:M20/M25/M40 family metallo-hydrolase [Baekduia soli]QEC49179.1 M20/M25/M40 family metallo-hydrolase [Baekduia soli]
MGDRAALLASGAVARTTAELVRVPSVTGDERAALERLGELAEGLGLAARAERHDLAAVQADPGWPGQEAPRDELLGLTVTVPSARAPAPGARRLALCGHVDVVGPGTERWEGGDPFSGRIDGGWVHGRGSADMKGGVAAALHALAAAGPDAGCEVVLHVVSSEEDGGQGAFAALRRDADYDACVIPEPTGFEVVCAQGGALTFTGVVHGRGAHAAERLHGVSAIDRYLPIHRGLAELEARLNAGVAHPLMAELALPYPLVVGRVQGGAWSSSVPDRLEFEGRAPVRVEDTLAEAMAAVEAAVAAAAPDDGLAVELAWTGGRFAPAQTPADSEVARLALAAAGEQLGTPARVTGVPYGSDMRLWCAAGVPTVMVGTSGIEIAHAVDERVSVAELGTLARLLASVIDGFGSA